MIQIPFSPTTMDHRTIVLLGVLALAATTVRHNFFITTREIRSAQRILVFFKYPAYALEAFEGKPDCTV